MKLFALALCALVTGSAALAVPTPAPFTNAFLDSKLDVPSHALIQPADSFLANALQGTAVPSGARLAPRSKPAPAPLDHMPIATPNPAIDYKMIVKAPDDRIDYKMIVVPIPPEATK